MAKGIRKTVHFDGCPCPSCSRKTTDNEIEQLRAELAEAQAVARGLASYVVNDIDQHEFLDNEIKKELKKLSRKALAYPAAGESAKERE